MVTKAELRQSLIDLGIKKGDIIHIHSAMRPLGPVEEGFAGVVEVFQEIITEEGLFTVPTHTWDIISKEQPVYHVSHTASNLGAFPNYILSRKDFKRSLHPTHSCASWGNRTEEFLPTPLDTPCPPGGNYGKFFEWSAKIVLLGVNLTRCTFFHCVEEMAGLGDIWSLSDKPYHVYAIDENDNKTSIPEYRGHKDCKSENFYRCEWEMQKDGVITQGFAGPAPVKIVDAVKAAEWLFPRFKKQPKYFW